MAKNTRFDVNTIEGLADIVQELANEVQRMRDPVRVEPNLKEIQEGELVFFDDGANRLIYTKLNGVLYKVALAAA